MRMIYTVFPFYEDARSVTKKMIEEKLVACANFWTIKTMYYFENTFKEKDETAVILKVKSGLLDQVRKRLREMHTYSIPPIIVIKPESVNNNYLQWVHESHPGPQQSPAPVSQDPSKKFD